MSITAAIYPMGEKGVLNKCVMCNGRESHVANALRAIFRDSFIVGLNALLGKSSMRYKLPSIFLPSKIELNIKIELRVD